MAISNQAENIERDPRWQRYSRQILFQHWGLDAQRKIADARVTLIGCGALGSVLADILVRAGLGFLRLVDRDYVEPTNLQRQILFTEKDAADGVPKAVAAAEKLAAINSSVRIEPVVADATHANIENLTRNAGLILDGTDNFETRFLVNDVAVKNNIPWVYGACVGSEGMVMPILPRITPCLRCIWQDPPPPGANPTCDTAGVLAPIVHIVASLQAVEAFKILTGRLDDLHRKLVQIDAWTGRFQDFDMQPALAAGDCPCCKHARYDFLDGGHTAHSVSLCGRDAVQIAGQPGVTLDFQALARRIDPVAKSGVTFNRYLLRFDVDNVRITLFADGRAIIKGVADLEAARSIYARYVGA